MTITNRSIGLFVDEDQARHAMKTTYVCVFVLLSLSLSPLGDMLSVSYPGRSFVRFLGILFPAVNYVAGRTGNVDQAAFVIALQWLLFPVYIFLFLIQQRPWVKLKTKPGVSAARLFILVGFCGIIAGLFVAGDVGAPFPSFYLGTVFDPSLGIDWLVFPYHGLFGLGLAALVMPLFDGLAWFCLISIVIATARITIAKFRSRLT